MDKLSIDALNDAVKQLNTRVDFIESVSKPDNTPWYKNISTLISVAAFLFSFGTTIVSYKRTLDQDVHNLRSELIGTLEKLGALPKQNIEAYEKYGARPDLYQNIAGYINQENQILTRQAVSIFKKLPNDQVSAVDYYSIATALEASRNFDSAIYYLKTALLTVDDLDDEVASLRALGHLQMITDRTGDSRKTFQAALDIFSKYPAYDDYTKTSFNITTEIIWANSEFGAGNKDYAMQHIASAYQTLERLPKGQAADFLRAQIDRAKSAIQQTIPASQPGALLPPGEVTTAPIEGGAPTHR